MKIESWLKTIISFILKYKVPIIVLTVISTAFCAYQLKNIKVKGDLISFIPQSYEVSKNYNYIGDHYGGNSTALVVIKTDAQDIFNKDFLNKICVLTEKIEDLEGIGKVTSISNIIDIKKIEGGMEVRDLIDKDHLPQTEQQLNDLKNYVLSSDMYVNQIVDQTGRYTNILCRVKPGFDETKVASSIKKLVYESKIANEIYLGGNPFQLEEINNIVKRDMLFLTPIVLVLIIFFLFMSFKNKRSVFAPIFTIVIALIISLGGYVLTGKYLSVLSGVVPVMLLAIGSAYGIHILSMYFEQATVSDDPTAVVKNTFVEIFVPVFLAGATTVIGFLSLGASGLSLISDFGFFTAAGIVVSLILSLILIPIYLHFLKVKKLKVTTSNGQKTWLIRLMDSLAFFVLKQEKLIILVTVIIALVSILGLPKIQREMNIVEFFKKDTLIRKSEQILRENFGGSTPIQILVKGDLNNPIVLKKMLQLEKYLNSLEYVNNAQSYASIIAKMNDVMNGKKIIPPTSSEIANLQFFIEGNDALDQLVNKDYTEAVIFASVSTLKMHKTEVIKNKIDAYLNKNEIKNLQIVKLSELSGQEQKGLLSLKAEETAQFINYDLAYKYPEQTLVNNEKIKQVLLQKEVWENKDLLKHKDSLTTLYYDYLLSDECEIFLEEGSAKKLSVSLGATLFQDTNIQKTVIQNIVQHVLPKSILQEDREGVELLADSLLLIAKNWQVEQNVNSLQKLIEQEFLADLKNNTEFKTDLKNNLYRFVADYAVIKTTEKGVAATFAQTGLPALFQLLDQIIISSLFQSLLLALFLVFIILSIMFRSVAGGLLSCIPIVFTILTNLGVMAYFNISLDVATMMISSISIGIGIDYTIHFISRFKKELKQGYSEKDALRITLETSGKAIMINALSVMAGFSVLMLSSLQPLQRFAFLISFTMVVSALGAVTILPAVLLVIKPKFMANIQKKGA